MNHRIYAVLLPALTTALFAFAEANWHLPYAQPDAYDYSAYYSADITSYLHAKPDLFKDELAKGWRYYKDTFIMANGLVNHQKGENSGGTWQPRNENEAVSEGQGYGMLLALLCNDQATFNRIFEAANQHMWDNGRKSYFCWKWQGGCTGQGAATDADLDIGLALVFADKLQERDLWNSYHKNGVTYRSRALEVIQSIRVNMTSSDHYLLPGDNWQGSGVNNLNPSYFATAWLKVFNTYQDEVDFTAVIDNCYAVLEKMPHYAKGQAANWIQPNGGRASAGGLDMGSDGIRTPWRIAMDALWFDDPRAKRYCAHSRSTLTAYATRSAGDLIQQMTLYDESGNAVSNQQPTCGEIAMWACAIVGSKDPSYATKGMNGSVLSAIIGGAGSGSEEFFGSSSLGDNMFYYKQSIAMLGFATIAGHFPNVLADLNGGAAPAQPVQVLGALTADKGATALPGVVEFTAELDKSAPWTLTVTGRSSGKIETFSGDVASISVQWTGAGWYTVETADARLRVTGLAEDADQTQLQTSVSITAVPPRPAVEPGATLLVHDLENNSTVNDWQGAWYLYTDESADGGSTTIPAKPEDLVQPNVGNPGAGIKIQFTVDQFAGVGMTLTVEGQPLDLTPFESVSFDYKTEGLSNLLFMIGTADITNYIYKRVRIDATGGQWQTRTVRMGDFQAPVWAPGIGMDLTVSQKVQWQAEQGASGTLYIDNVALTLKEGKRPGDDIMGLIDASATAGRPTVAIPNRGAPATVVYDRGVLVFSGIAAPRAAAVHTALGRTLTVCEIQQTGAACVAKPRRSLAGGVYFIRVRLKQHAKPVTLRLVVR